MPAENDPAEPNALMQSLQLTCSLTPSNTVPSTRLVIIWLKCWIARFPIDPALESAPVTGQGPSQLAAYEQVVSAPISASESAPAVSSADTIQVLLNFAIVSARTACQWDR